MLPLRRRLLLVEDDAFVAASILQGLRRAGFEVELVCDGARGAEKAIAQDIALVVLDLMLPERDGFDVLSAVRARSSVPIIVVSARTELRDRLRAFELGAVDYLPKPFFVEELLARIDARLGPAHGERRAFESGGARIDLDGRHVEVDGSPVHLTPTEFAVLRYLAERAGRAVSRSDLAAALRDLGDSDPRNVDAHVSRLRRKLGKAGALLSTVWGHGYRFEGVGSKAAPS